MEAYHAGRLGGERMTEDANPGFARASAENYIYFTLPMALNYQRNSYSLWESALATCCDPTACTVFDTRAVVSMDESVLREMLTRHRLALQPNKQPEIWRTLCCTIENELGGDLRRLFIDNGCSVQKIKEYISANRKKFPYLGGNKICNYWLHVMEKYTDVQFTDRENITVAPDTHVLQASQRLGIITPEDAARSDAQQLTAARWQELLRGTGLAPIDMHTPMWLWSRSGFALEI